MKIDFKKEQQRKNNATKISKRIIINRKCEYLDENSCKNNIILTDITYIF